MPASIQHGRSANTTAVQRPYAKHHHDVHGEFATIGFREPTWPKSSASVIPGFAATLSPPASPSPMRM
jgi:hypothetical protein